MKKKILVILIVCLIFASCNKKEIAEETQIIEKPEVTSRFDEDFYKRVNHYFSLEYASEFYTIDNFRLFHVFSQKNVYNPNNIKELNIYIINELNDDYFLSENLKYEEGCVFERSYYTSSYSTFFEYDDEKRKIKISTNGKTLSYQYICDYENNTYTSIDDRNDKVIIKKTSNGYELQNKKTYDDSIYKYYYTDKILDKVEVFGNSQTLPDFVYNYQYLENRIVIQQIRINYPENIYDYEEINFLDNTIEIIEHADSKNSERRIILSEFDQNNNWCLAEEYRDGKFYAKYKRVFVYKE